MCGIIASLSYRDVLPLIMEGLSRLEYRGYDSSGVVILDNGSLKQHKAQGKLSVLKKQLESRHLRGVIGLGHTRWATHGAPSCANAHPHFSCDNRIGLVHNGIIENYQALKSKLTKLGHKFSSQTDTEVVVHLIESYYKRSHNPLESVRKAVNELEGSFALAIIFADHPDSLFAVRLNSPLIVGVGQRETFLASDVPAILPYTKKVIYLAERQIVHARRDGDNHRIDIIDFEGRKNNYQIKNINWDITAAEKEGYPHFMLKEIFEQPGVVGNTIRYYIDPVKYAIKLNFDKPIERRLRKVNRVVFVACGTAWHAALVAKYAIEELARIPVEVALGSEFRYSLPVLDSKTLVVAISQSGETADTLAAIRAAKQHGVVTMAVCNTVGSSLTREVQSVFYTYAGPEISVASTKAYTTQLAVVILSAIYLARLRGVMKPAQEKSLIKEFLLLPQKMSEVLQHDNVIRRYAKEWYDTHNFMYIARRYNLPNAYEGALKMKEISYTHAEGYGAGEMKHGPLALVDDTFPTVAIATRSAVYEKMLSNMQEVKARKGVIIAIATAGDRGIGKIADEVIDVPDAPEILSPILTVIPLQLLAYHTAVKKGCNIDQPRNLAKSVTVE
ncbi:MAG: glutamine--fructose-6-phosphate transaminase (isomerizing) [Candidatus Brocadiia bacterium]